jgi:CheY-like chemotaxis protein
MVMVKMLVVDDDPAWRALYRMGFEGDFEVFEAVDGLDALAALDRIRPDVIVLDLRMPHLDGMGFLRQMDRRGWKVPVIVCSGTFTMDSPPAIPGVFPAQKSPDLRNIWSALETALPRPVEIDSSLVKSRVATEETVWRD